MSVRLHFIGLCTALAAALILGQASLVSAHGGGGGGGGGGGHGGGGFGGGGGFHGGGGGGWGGRSFGGGGGGGGWGGRSYGGGWGGRSIVGGVGAGAFRSGISPYRPLNGGLVGYDRYGRGYYGRGFEGRGFAGYGGYGFGGLGWGWGYPWWDDYASTPWWSYGDYSYPADTYTTTYAAPSVVSGYADSTPIETASSTPIDTASASDYYAQALDAFHEGSYANALRLAGHAAVDNPRDPNVHLLLSLSMFALGNYQGAAAEAHAVAAMGAKVDWKSLIGFYNNDVSVYTSQARALEAYVTKNPSLSGARFLLGFHYLAQGFQDAARTELLPVVNAVPQDRITADLLTQAGGHVPESVARQLKENAGHDRGPTPGPSVKR